MDSKRLLRMSDVRRLVGLSRSGIYQRVSEGSFPQPVRLGERAVAWIEGEIHAWIESRVKASRP